MAIADQLSSEESKIMQEMQANEPAERDLIREEKTGISNEEPEQEAQLRPEVQALIKEPEAKVEENKTEEKAEEKPEKRMVPLSELQEERKSRKDALEAARIAQERMDLLLAKLVPSEPVKPPADIDKDPIGAVKEMKGELEQLRQFRMEQERQAQQNQHVNQIKEMAKAQEAEYVKENPDYVEAGNFLMKQRIGQLKAMGHNESDARRMMANESLALADNLVRQGRNVAQTIHELAKSSGFQPKAPAAASEQERLDNIAKGQRQNVSLSSANGVQQKTGAMNGAAIAKMSEAEFAKFYEKLNGEDRRAVLGQ